MSEKNTSNQQDTTKQNEKVYFCISILHGYIISGCHRHMIYFYQFRNFALAVS